MTSTPDSRSPQAAPSPLDILRRYWGYEQFRGIQQEIIQSVLTGHDTLGLMPTGGGKSIAFQVPALALEGVCIVVTPLIALMKDQVAHLRARSITAAAIYSGQSRDEMLRHLDNAVFGAYKFLYVSPERLTTEIFQVKLRKMKVGLLTVDEAHCISQWGYDFRPPYLQIAQIRKLLPGVPVLALTATATTEVVRDICAHLAWPESSPVVTGEPPAGGETVEGFQVYKMSFARPNLSYVVRKTTDKFAELLHILRSVPGSAIVYTRNRERTRETSDHLNEEGITALYYHAGLKNVDKDLRSAAWQSGETRVMVATNAFGMGIDKSNVSYVIHYNMPQSLESYYQEAGRAGRDGAEAECILLYAPGDVQTAKYLIQHPALSGELSQEELEQKQRLDLERLDVMVNYCKTQECLRGYILDYFGQEHESFCGNCSNCSTETEERDITDQARMILSCVQRMSAKLGYSLGLTSVVRTLLGSRDKRLLQLGLDKLGSYGMLRKLGKDDLRAMAENLESQGYLETDPVHGGVSLTQKAQGVLFEGKTVSMRLPKAEASAPVSSPIGGGQDPNLLAMLKRLRWKIAMQESVPAYIIFSNATLEDMARKAPTTLEAFAKVNGVGSVKVKRFGEVFVDAIADYLQEHGG